MTGFFQTEPLPNFHDRHTDYRTRDETGRELGGHIAGRFAIVFWDDFANRHIKILGVTWADEVM